MDRQMFTFPPYMYYEEEPEHDWRIPGTMQRSNTLSTLMHGVRFLHGMQSPPKSPDEEVKKISTLPSVLDFSNRRALARQGFYGQDYMYPKTKSECHDEESTKSVTKPSGKKSLSAAQKRQKFQDSVRSSRSRNWSLTNEDEEGDTTAAVYSSISEESTESFDKGLVLRSFSERFSSDSSLESYDSYEESHRRKIVKQNSISHLRRQYQETIRKSMDGNDVPVFDAGLDDDGDEDDDNYGDKGSISRMREKQVERLMSQEVDDGDYCHDLLGSLNRPKLSKNLDSTQSTLVGTPKTPNDIKFSFDDSLQDGQSEFDFSSPPSPTQENPDPPVSIVIDTDINDNDPKCRDVDEQPCCKHSSNTNCNELSMPSLVLRSDSCNTLVPQDSDAFDGDSTPRGGDVSPGLIMNSPEFHHISTDTSSESTGSCATLNTVLPGDLEERSYQDLLGNESLGWSADTGGEHHGKGLVAPDNRLGGMDQLKPSVCQPQESFELEEISSADNGIEDLNGNSCKYSGPRVPMEKSFSTQSDSSGFADVDGSGEINLLVQDLPKEHIVSQRSKPSLFKQKTLQPESHDPSPSYHDNHRYPFNRVQSENVQLFKSADSGSVLSRPEHTTSYTFPTENICSCDKRVPVTNSYTVQPTLTSISYNRQECQPTDKALMFTVDLPIIEETVTNKSHDKSHERPRYVSSLKLDIYNSNDSLDSSTMAKSSPINSVAFKQRGAITYTKILGASKEGELDNRVTKYDEVKDATSAVRQRGQKSDKTVNKSSSFDESTPKSGDAMFQSDVLKMSAGELKQNVLQKRRAKEALIAANSQTADWLLGSQKHREGHVGDGRGFGMQFKVGRPSWASTPNLKHKSQSNRDDARFSPSRKRSTKPETSHSLDLLDDDDDTDDNHQVDFLQHSNMMFREGDSISSENFLGFNHTRTVNAPPARRRFAPVVHEDSNYSSSDESVSVRPTSLHSSSASVPEDFLHFQKLMRLVNGPSMFLKSSDRMPTVRFTPNLRMKDWTQPSRHKQLEEEARLMQYAVRRYKEELFSMEAVLVKMYEHTQSELSDDDMADVEEVRHLWREVGREVGKMEDLLTDRLVSVETGNISYTPLDSLQVVQGMINLLREQLYHHQMCLTKDVHLADDDLLDNMTSVSASVHSTSCVSDAMLTDISVQVTNMKDSLVKSQQCQKQEMEESLTKFRETLLEEVKDQVSSTKNAEMLQLQLQARENEIRRLKMALASQTRSPSRVKTNQTIESDV